MLQIDFGSIDSQLFGGLIIFKLNFLGFGRAGGRTDYEDLILGGHEVAAHLSLLASDFLGLDQLQNHVSLRREVLRHQKPCNEAYVTEAVLGPLFVVALVGRIDELRLLGIVVDRKQRRIIYVGTQNQDRVHDEQIGQKAIVVDNVNHNRELQHACVAIGFLHPIYSEHVL